MTVDAAERRVQAARNWTPGTLPPIDPEDLEALVPDTPDEPLATVLIPCHDDGAFLLDALASVRCCVDEALQVVIIDDASTDEGTLRLLDRLAALGVSVCHAAGKGPAGARNVGLDAARADVVLPLDADNLVRPGFVRASIEVLKARPEVAAVFAAAQRFGLDDHVWPMTQPHLIDLLSGNKLDNCAVLRADALAAVDGWNPSLSGSEDWLLWLDLLDAGWELHTIDRIGFDYRVRDASLHQLHTPRVHLDHIDTVVRLHPRLYARHAVGVVRNFAAQVVELREALEGTTPPPPPAGADPWRLIRQLTDEVAALEAQVEADRRGIHQANRRAEDARAALDHARARIDELDAQLDQERARAADAEAHLDAFERTRLVRWSNRPRDLYASIRRRTDG